ncbi:MAG TPA: class I tRNA ligase family protein [Candidatus Gracilibacteria bacterium]
MKTAYDHTGIEDEIYKAWEASGLMQADVKSDKKPFTIVLPPPNVTGQLHLGHAAMLAIEDIMIRYKKMKGYEALWIPGTDHAAIATETVVVKKLGLTSREEMGREEFLEEARKFAEEKHDTIVNQTKKMGAWLDWSREAYTLDEARNTAVKTMFEMMYEDGLIERGHRMINWSTGAQSVLSDDELEWEDIKEPFYYIRCGEFIIGTVRSETKCSDSPVVVHPEGDYVRVKYKPTPPLVREGDRPDLSGRGGLKEETFIMSRHLFENTELRQKTLNLLDGEFVLVESMKGKELEGQSFEYHTYAGKRKFFVLCDEAIDMEKGSGAMTISICHAGDDYEIAKRHKDKLADYYFEKIDKKGHMTQKAGACAGMTVIEARKASGKIMKDQGLLVGMDYNYEHRVPKCYRSDCVVEPMISPQWFIMVEKEFTDRFGGGQTTLKAQMQEAVRGGHINIIPDKFDKMYFHWIDNLRDWCISRQIWWGHRIPVWYDKEGNIKAYGRTEGKAIDPSWIQDEDTLDTWFSSALWPFSTLGWPNESGLPGSPDSDFEKFYPNDVLETGWDIIFFWVARMIMFGRYATGKYPFHTVYLHGMVCDEHGKKMSKSKGNGIDPLEVIGEVGADAVRLSLVIGSTPGNPIPLGHNKIKGYRNFVNKLWNAGRFVKMQMGVSKPTPNPSLVREGGYCPPDKGDRPDLSGRGGLFKEGDLSLPDRWILSRFSTVAKEVSESLETYQISAAGDAIYHFVWNEFCDWYIEASKVDMNTEVLGFVFAEILKLTHPLCPFITENLWKEVFQTQELENLRTEEQFIIETSYPDLNMVDQKSEEDFALVQKIVTALRKLRTDQKLNPKEKLQAKIKADAEAFKDQQKLIIDLGQLSDLSILSSSSLTGGSSSADLDSRIKSENDNLLSLIVEGIEVLVDIPIDEEAEKARLGKQRAELEKKKVALEGRLSNPSYRDKAPEALVKQTEAELEQVSSEIAKLKS